MQCAAVHPADKSERGVVTCKAHGKLEKSETTPMQAEPPLSCLRVVLRALFLLWVVVPLLAIKWCTPRTLWWRWAARAAERCGAVPIKLAQWAARRL